MKCVLMLTVAVIKKERFMDNKKEVFMEVLKKEREKAGWSQRELAKRSGVSNGLIGQYETNCKKNPCPTQLIALAKALGKRKYFFVESAYSG